MEIHEDTWRVARVRVRRQAEEEGILTRVEQEVEREQELKKEQQTTLSPQAEATTWPLTQLQRT